MMLLSLIITNRKPLSMLDSRIVLETGDGHRTHFVPTNRRKL